MFVVTLTFSKNKTNAPQFMDAHNAWIKNGFEDGIFLMTGSLQDGSGGAVIAYGITRHDLEARVKVDPFVAENIVTPAIMEIKPGRVDDRLAFLKG